MSSDAYTDHDYYLTCAFTRVPKNKRPTSLSLQLNKLHTPLFLWDTIIHDIDKLYNNGLVDDIPASCSTPYNNTEMINCTHLQQHIGCGHFIRGRISASFHSPINTYFRCNHLGKCFACSFWFRSIIPFLWDLHHNAWLHYCNNIDSPDKTIRWITTAKSILLHIVDKYILEAKILPKNKRIFFACKKLQYQS